MSKETIGIIGAGNVGGALAGRLSAVGHKILFGVRDPARIAPLADGLPDAEATTPSDATARANLIFLTVPGAAALEVATSMGDLNGKILVDCTNPMRWDKGPVWTPPEEGSNTAAIAARCPGVLAIKAFNTFGAEFHADPNLGDSQVEVLMAGDDADAKKRLSDLATSIGFASVDAGPLRNASVLENHALLWIHLALAGGQGRDFVFKMIRRRGSSEIIA